LDITLSAEQEALLKIMEETSQHLFITGRAGAGKSVLLREFRAQTKKRVVVCAPTGIAALNVKGQTIHSLFKLKGQLYDEDALTKLIPNSRLRTLLKRIDTVIVDEISMVRADLLDVIDTRLRDAHKNDIPFGGVQVVMFGDPYQLPPVVDEGLAPYFESVHGGHYFFNALVWKEAEFKVYELTQVFRQKDPVFKDVLNAMRDGSINDQQIAQLNERYDVSVNDGIPMEGVVTLAPTNALVSQINEERLRQLKGKMHQYTADISGEMKKSAFPTEEHLQLKEGAQVVMLKNDPDGCWVNGTVGTVAELLENEIKVRIDGIAYTLKKETWEETVYEYDFETKKVEMKVASSFTQFPVRLAFALTIHKSQGQTYEQVAIDLTTAAFATGQMYVALSRCTSLEGLYLKVPVKRDSVMVDPKITAFMQRRETIKVAVEETDIYHDKITPVHEEVQTAALIDPIVVDTTVDICHDKIVPAHASGLAFVPVNVDPIVVDALPPELYHDKIEEPIVVETIVTELAEGRVARITTIEVLCPKCNKPCVDQTGSSLITPELTGHTVTCSACQTACTVPLNAFSLNQGDVVAREKPAGKADLRPKRGRSWEKQKTSNKGRPMKSGRHREPLQLSLNIRTIVALQVLGRNKSELFEELLDQYQPFLDALPEADKRLKELEEIEEDAE
jgi:ATP-dependent DNA helicase PIF1